MMDSQPKALRLADAMEKGDANFYAESSMWFDGKRCDGVSEAAAELRRQHAEIERLRADAEFAAHKLESTRVWNGSGWAYNELRPFHYMEALDRLRAALKEPQ